jgi:DivIVA domain-containing protein
VELDRQAIERSDFDTARKGYDPVQVDAHLREVSAAVEELRARLDEHDGHGTLAGAASERVRAILDAAEAGAAVIRSEAEDEARRIVDEARHQADELERAAERSRRGAEQDAETVGAERRRELERRADEMMRRADELENEVDGMLARVRTAVGDVVESIHAEVERLRAGAAELSSPGATTGSETSSGRPDDGTPSARDADAAPTEAPPEQAMRAAPERAAVGEPAGGTARPTVGDGGSKARVTGEPRDERDAGARDTEGARLIALNMALSGKPRDETARYLRENFDLDRADALLDEVYAKVGS